MYAFPVTILLALIFANLNTSYHSHLKFKKYIKVKNPIIAKILINQSNPLYTQRKNIKSNQNKLLFGGLIFYVLCLIMIIFSIILIYIFPRIPIPLYEFDVDSIYILTNSLNEKIIVMLTTALIFAEIIFYHINITGYAVEMSDYKKITKWMNIVMILMYLYGFVYSIWVIFSDIFNAWLN